jgi:intein/homing endonuclease
MIKIVTPSAFDFDQPVMSLMNVHSKGVDRSWLQKSAAVLTKEMSELKPEKGITFVHLIALGDMEAYGCFFAGAPVQTSDGLKPIETIQEGERVLTHTGSYKKVIKTFAEWYAGERVSIKPRCLPHPIECTTEHPIHVVRAAKCTAHVRFDRRRGGIFDEYIDELVEDAEWVPAKDVACGDFLVVPCGVAATHSEPRPDEFDPYVVGLYVAEGCLSREYNDVATKGQYTKLVFALSDKDEASIEYTQSWLESIGRTRVKLYPSLTSDYGCRLVFGFKELAQWLDETFGHSATTKRIHPSVFSWSEEDKLKFIAGYLDGNGYIDLNADRETYYGTVKWSTASLNLALDLQRLLGSLGVGSSISAGVNRHDSGCFGHKDFLIYECSVGSRVSDYVTQRCLRLSQHGKISSGGGSSIQTSGRYMLVPVASVLRESIEPTTKYNIEVEDDNSYVVYANVHNSNRNGDGFPKSANEKYHHTFVKHAKWYHNHKNKPHLGHPDYGFVKLSAYNPEMHRVELVVGIDEKKDPDSIQKLASGQDIPVSMACVTDPDYPVLTNNGYKPISGVTTEDVVLTHTGKWHKVKQLNRRKYTGDLITFSVNGLPMPLEVTADHMMFSKVFSGSRTVDAVKAKAGRYFKDPDSFDKEPAGWAHAEHVQVGDRFFYQPITNRPGYAAIDDINLARLLGYYTAEGSLQYNKDRACSVVFTCNMDDMAVRELPVIVNDLNVGTHCTMRPRRNSAAALEVGVHSTGLAELVRRIAGVGCRGKVVPPEIFNSGADVKLAYVGSWHEGDGWSDKKGVHWSTASHTLALECRDILISVGIPSSIYKIDHASCETSGHAGSGVEYTVNVSWHDAAPLVKWSHKAADSEYSVTGVDRRRPPTMRECLDGRYAYRVKDTQVRHVEDVQTYNIEVEEDESYLLAGLISHNCRVPFDVCTVCQNKAKNPSEYCFLPGTYVTMHDGTVKPIEDIKEGDSVAAADGSKTTVLKTFVRDVDETIADITTSVDGTPISATLNHPVLSSPYEDAVCAFVKKSAGSRQPSCIPGLREACHSCRKARTQRSFVAVSDLQVGDLVYSPVLQELGSYPAAVDDEYAWVLGLYMAEGSVACSKYTNKQGVTTKTPSSVEFSLNEKETDFISRLQRFFFQRFSRDIKVYSRPDDTMGVSARMHSRELAEEFLSLIPGHAVDKKLTTELITMMDQSCLESFYKGLMDGDGCYYEHSTSTSLTRLNSASLNLVAQSFEISKVLGHAAYIGRPVVVNGGPTTRTNKFDQWYMTTTYGQPATEQTCVTRGIHEGHMVGYIRNITHRKYKGPVYNIETEAGTYVAGHIAVHNCDHIKEAVTQFTNDGRQIGMINYEPDFFDISKVRRNADRIAFSLRKVAGVEDVVLGVELARQWGITEPDDLVKDAKLRSRIDLLRKLAAMEKEIDGEIQADSNMQSIADSIQDLPGNCGTVPQEQLGGLLREFANARVSLPLEDFLKLVMGDRYGEVSADVPSARSALPCVFSEALEHPEEFINGTENYEPIDKCVPNPLKRVVESIARTGSLDAGPVGGKVQISVLRKNASDRNKAPVTEAGKRLAEEYARYKFAFVEHVQDPFVVKMSILQNFGN